MAPSPLRPTIILLATALLLSHATAFTNDFSLYPLNAQPCLYSAANASSCNADNGPDMNKCLCGNGGSNGFVSGSAACLGANDTADVSSTFAVMEDSCSNSKTPIALSLDQFKAAAAAAASSSGGSASKTATKTSAGTGTSTGTMTSASAATTTPSASEYVTTVSGTPQTVTVTSSPSPTNTNPSSSNPPNNTAIIAGAAIGGAVFLLLIALAAFCIIRSRRRKAAGEDEAQHMLPQSGYGPFSGGDFAMQNRPGIGSGTQGDTKWRPPSGQSTDWQQPPAGNPQFNWDSPYDYYGKNPVPSPGPGGQGGMGYHQPPPVDQSGQLTPGFAPGPMTHGQGQGQTAYGAQQPAVFELQGAETPVNGQAPVEAPASPVRPLRGAHNYPPPTWQQQ